MGTFTTTTTPTTTFNFTVNVFNTNYNPLTDIYSLTRRLLLPRHAAASASAALLRTWLPAERAAQLSQPILHENSKSYSAFQNFECTSRQISSSYEG